MQCLVKTHTYRYIYIYEYICVCYIFKLSSKMYKVIHFMVRLRNVAAN
jgi:hypothetical protein